ncbi:MAG: preprotein translocase subunit SecG [Chloroflexi bacterium]|nr:preprotein translocase subunit SecG [Chloroflexota bacterium]
MGVFFGIAQIVIAIALVAVLMLQVKGGGIGGIFGQADTVYRTRRGVEKILFQLTIVLAVLLCVISIITLLTIRI